ncbi:hypothetical protein D3C71_1025600 [compost metagenome]
MMGCARLALPFLCRICRAPPILRSTVNAWLKTHARSTVNAWLKTHARLTVNAWLKTHARLTIKPSEERHRRPPSPASLLDGWRAYRCEKSKRLSAARHPSLHLPHLTAGPIENHSPPARKRPPRRRINDAYAECGRPRGRIRRAPKISSVIGNLAAREPRRRSSSPGSGGWRATLMRPRESEGKAAGLDEDDDGAVRSEGSGPQSWARATHPTPATGDLRSSPSAPTKQNPTKLRREQPTAHYPRHLEDRPKNLPTATSPDS